MNKTLFHGTSKKVASHIRTKGLDILAKRQTDFGLIGYGIYLSVRESALHYGPCLFQFEINMSRIMSIKDPYSPNIGNTQERFWKNIAFTDLYYEQDRIYREYYHKKHRYVLKTHRLEMEDEYLLASALDIRQSMLKAGYHGIESPGYKTKEFNFYELVLYSKVPIISMKFVGCYNV